MQWIIFIAPLFVVLGHQKWGAVNAVCSGEKMPSPNLQAIVDKIEPAVAQARSHAKGDQVVEAAIEENVRQTPKMYSPIAPSSARRCIRENFKWSRRSTASIPARSSASTHRPAHKIKVVSLSGG
jgi:hypothetical protein